jgi:uncharacterized protein with GYD domain
VQRVFFIASWESLSMATFMCFLNWTDQGAKPAKEVEKRHQATKMLAEKLGGR